MGLWIFRKVAFRMLVVLQYCVSTSVLAVSLVAVVGLTMGLGQMLRAARSKCKGLGSASHVMWDIMLTRIVIILIVRIVSLLRVTMMDNFVLAMVGLRLARLGLGLSGIRKHKVGVMTNKRAGTLAIRIR